MDLMDYRRKIIANSPHLMSASGAVASFTDGADLPLKSLVVNIEPVQSGTGDPSPSNIRPISGWDAVGVTRTGKNILAPVFYSGITYNASVGTVLTLTELTTGITVDGDTYSETVGGWQGFGMCSPKLATGTYYLMAELASANMRSSIYVLNSDMSVSRNLGNQGSGTTRSIGMVIALSGDESYIAFNCLTSSAGTVSISTPMVALSSSATSFEPYTGQTINILFGRRNMWDEEWETGSISGQDGLTVNDSSRIRSKNFSPCTPSTTYYKGNVNIFWYGADKGYLSYNTASSSNTVTSPSNAYYFKIATLATYGGTYNHDISINYPATDHNYSPYNGNYLHINQWDEVWETGTLNASGEPQAADNCIRSKNFCPIAGGQQYYLYTSKTDGGSQNRYYTKVVFYDANKGFISGSYENRRVFTAPSNAAYFKIYTNSSTVVYGGTYNYDISVNYPATDTTYHPYNEFIVNGGTLNVLTGELAVDRYVVDPSQWTQYKANNGYKAYRIYGIPNGRYGTDAMNMPLSNMIAKFGPFSSSAMSENIIQTPSPEADRAYLALQDGIDPTTVDLSYLMLTPITYHLDPQTIRSLYGQNNIWADTGNVALEYWAHP